MQERGGYRLQIVRLFANTLFTNKYFVKDMQLAGFSTTHINTQIHFTHNLVTEIRDAN